MSDASERFLDLATKPLERNHELHVHARSEIGSKLKPGVDEALEEASRRMEKSDRTGLSAITARWIGWAVVLTILVYLGIQVRALNESRQVVGVFINTLDYMDDWNQMVGSHVARSMRNRNQSDRLLLETDRAKVSEASRWLWNSEPTNAALFANYAAFHFQIHKELPPDYLKTATELDPENGWFLVLAAAASADASVKGESKSSSGKGARSAQQWAILDSEELEKAIAYLQQAAQLPKFESYQEVLHERRRALLPSDGGAPAQMMNSFSCDSASPSLSVIPGKIANVIAAKAQVLATTNDVAGFKRLLTDWRTISESIIAQPDSGVFDRLVQKVLVGSPVRNLKEAAEQLGLEDEARRLREVDSLTELQGKERKSRDLSERDQFIEDHGSVWGEMSLQTLGRTVKRPLALNDVDLLPGRRIDHALFSSAVAALLASMFLVITAAIAAYRYRHGRLCRELANRLASLFTARNWCIVLTCGLILPSLYFAVIRYFTPLGRLGWSLKMPFLLIPAGQYALLFCLILATSLLIIRHLISKQTAFLATPRPRQRLGIFLTILGFVVLPLCGLAKEAGWQEPAFVAGATGLGLLVLWLVGLLIRAMFGRADLALGRQMIGRLLVPILITAAAMFSATISIHHAEERHWMRQDKVLGLNPENPDSSEYESAVKDQMRAELLEVLAPLEAISR